MLQGGAPQRPTLLDFPKVYRFRMTKKMKVNRIMRMSAEDDEEGEEYEEMPRSSGQTCSHFIFQHAKP